MIGQRQKSGKYHLLKNKAVSKDKAWKPMEKYKVYRIGFMIASLLKVTTY